MPTRESTALRILVVDGYVGWRSSVGEALLASGYEVWTAGRGREALVTLANLADSERRVDLVLTEVELADLTGFELARRARGLCPEVRVLYMGYDDERRMDAARLLRKPFSLVGLELAVRRATRRAAQRRCA